MRRRLLSPLTAQGLPPGSRVLEVGCGTGSNLAALDRSSHGGLDLAGVDLSLPMLAVAARKTFSSRVLLVQGDAARLPLADGSCDAVLAGFALHEMPQENRDLAAAEMHRVLRAGGLAMVADLARPEGLAGRLLFPLLRIMESREALELAAVGPAPIFARHGFTTMRAQGMLLGLVGVTLFRKNLL